MGQGSRMFKTILIANRGEIACRIIRSAKAMGIRTIAVYSEPDADARHVRLADEAIAIGPAPARQSYLDGDRILEAARRSGAEAIHPGYGFLSEKASFAEAVAASGLVFIGPTPAAIAAMGDKIESKRLAAAAGISMVPGHLEAIADAAAAERIAREIGYPVMIKASAGGGGKGMRIAGNDAELREGFRSARSEAAASFADDRVFIEKYVVNPRHIEIQILADAHGQYLYLGERECSIQRRHQKVIEEAPSPALDEKTRAAMGAEAVALARAVGYRSAGTVEFILDADRNFYFLEMNTRLQVEHPVTEKITGLDLVEWMIRIAAGEKLPFRQSDIALRGWAIEARIYAEDPYRHFLPATGRLTQYREPSSNLAIRVDSGVLEGSDISMFYDPMIAKLIATGETRAAAIEEMRQALDGFYIRGLTHNIPFLAALIDHPRFRAGRLTTGFIAEEFPDGFTGAALSADRLGDLLAIAAIIHHRYELRAHAHAPRFRTRGNGGDGRWVVVHAGRDHPVAIVETAAGHAALIDGRSREAIDDWRLGDPVYRGRIDNRPIAVQIDRRAIGYRLTHGGAVLDLRVLSPRAAELNAHMLDKPAPDLSRYLLSPMPGLLVSLLVEAGQKVKAGDTLCVVEAMKMENILKAERDSEIARIAVKPGESLAVDQIILEFAP